MLPTYARTNPVGVVHLGLGAFHRAHQALVFDGLLQSGDARWGVLGVAMRSTALADALFQFALKTITALLRLAVLQHCLRLRALFSFLMQIGISPARWLVFCANCQLRGGALAGGWRDF